MSDSRFDPNGTAGRKACVLGMGRSGIAAANLLSKKKFEVLVSEARPRKEVRPAAKKLGARIRWEAGGHSGRVLKCDFAVKSPGISGRSPVVERLRRAGIPVFSELETALAFCRPAKVVAVTGTNGKSTTASLLGAVFKAAGRRVHVAGNIGVPLASVVSKIKSRDVLVLEASSYQLEDSRWFRPAAAAIMNVTPDHLDHHGGMPRYVAAKARVFRDQAREDCCVFNADDPISVRISRQCPSRKLFFSHEPSAASHAWLRSGRIHARLPPAKKSGKTRELRLVPPNLPGLHNMENAMAAALIALDCGVGAGAIQKAFRSFKGVEHRIESCGIVRGIACVNDSKATNVESTLIALKALAQDRPAGGKRILLILGGLHKGFSYAPLKPWLESCVRGILTIGSAAEKIEEDLSGVVPIFPCKTLEEAVKTGLQIGEPGDTLLLSPACASFDQFRDFEHRGRCFKDMVRKMGRL